MAGKEENAALASKSQEQLYKQARGEGPKPWENSRNRAARRRLSLGVSGSKAGALTTIQSLLPQHAQYLIDRGITDEVAIERGYTSARTRAQLRDAGFPDRQQLVPALLIQLRSAQGQQSAYQIRPDRPRVFDGRIAKFELVAGSTAVIDVPVRLNRTPDPRIKGIAPLIFTEGCLKADSAAGIDLVCAALVGVWGVIIGTPDGSTAISCTASTVFADVLPQ